MKKSISIFAAFSFAVGIVVVGGTSANAHVGIDTRGTVATVGGSLTYEMRLGHGCTAADGNKYGTHVFVVAVPAAAGVPTPQAVPGYTVVVTPSAIKDASGVPVTNTVTWTAKSANDDIQINAFAEFGLRGKPLAAGVAWFDTTQICRVPKTVTAPATIKKVNGKKVTTPGKTTTTYTELLLNWSVHDSAAPTVVAADGLSETGPAPSLNIAAAAAK